MRVFADFKFVQWIKFCGVLENSSFPFNVLSFFLFSL